MFGHGDQTGSYHECRFPFYYLMVLFLIVMCGVVASMCSLSVIPVGR